MPRDSHETGPIHWTKTWTEARKTYWRKASVIMACVQFNETQDRNASHYFDASWEQKWWGGKVMTIRSNWPMPDTATFREERP